MDNKRMKLIKEFGILFYTKVCMYTRLKKYDRLHNFVLKKLKNICFSTLQEYTNIDNSLTKKSEIAKKRIWFLWWQGLGEMPEVVDRCYKSVVKNRGNYEVVLINKSNYNKFVDINPRIIQLFETGDIGYASMSDILRMNLLKEHGGIWVDGLSFISDTVPDNYQNFELIMRKKGYDANLPYVPKGRWGMSLIATGYTNTNFFNYMCDAYNEYFSKYDVALHFFIVDYLIALAYENIGVIKKLIDDIPVNNQNNRALHNVLNKPFDKETWNKIRQTNWIHSLNWRTAYVKKDDGKDTFYKVIVDETDVDD